MQRFLSDESGATAIEYGLIAALVAVASITAFATLGTSFSSMFGMVETRATEALDTAFD